jgi:glyoxylase-like metal-dependent hydrolase (beta-lactamase superfamily II)
VGARGKATTVDRRTLLLELATLCAALPLLPRGLRAQSAPLKITRWSDRLLLVQGPGANSLVVDGPAGVALVGGGHAAWSDALLAAVGENFRGRPVSALVNTHWHDEQTGANRRLGEQKVAIVAHENTKLWLGSEVWVRWSDKKYPPLPKAAQPTTTFYESTDAELAGRRVQYVYTPKAHTDGDIAVFFPDDNVLAAPGFVSNDGWPVIDWWTGGWTGGMLDGFDRLLEVANAATRIVPANGPPMTLAELKAQQTMYTTVFGRIHDLLIKALGTAEVLAAKPTAEYDAQFGDPKQFVTLAFQSTWGHLRDAYDTRLRNIA